MARVRTARCYLKENLAAFGCHLDEYMAFLAADGRTGYNLANVRAAIRSFLARMPPMGPEDVGPEEMELVRGVMAADGLHPVYIKQAMLYTGRFIGHMTGRNPYLQIDPDGAPDWYEGHLGRFLFQDELEAFTDALRSAGYSESTVNHARLHAVVCMRVLEKDLGVARLEDVDARCMDHLGRMMAGVSADRRTNVLFNLGRFVGHAVGRPVGASASQSFLGYRDTPEWSDFQTRLSEFLEDQVERGLRPRTVGYLRRDATSAYKAIAESFGPVRISDIDLHMMREARRRMSGRMKQVTVRHYLMCLGRVIEFSHGVNPYRQAAMLWGVEQVDRTWITPDDWKRAWAIADETERVVLALAGGMGMRLAEIAGLDLADVSEGEVVIRGKGSGPRGKVEVKAMPPTVAAVISAYLPVRRAVLDAYGDRSEGRLLVMNHRKRGTPATIGYVTNLVRALSDRVGVRFSCHTLRRFYCLSLLDSGVDLDTVRRMMRHESLATTLDRYARADPRRMASATDAIERGVFGAFS